MNLHVHQRIGRIIFWFAQAVGIITVLALLIFIGGTLIDEILNQLINFREDYEVFLFFFCEVLVAVAIIISWHRKRRGPVLIIALTILIIIWGREDINIIMLHLPLLFSGLLLLFYYYYKEWILKQKA